jgi:hypothetical protein
LAQSFFYVRDFVTMGATHAGVQVAFTVLDEVGAEFGLERKLSKDKGRDSRCNSWSS